MTELDILTALARAGCCQATSELITIMSEITLKQLKSKSAVMGYAVEDDKEFTTLYVHAPEGKAWESGELHSLVHPYGQHGVYTPDWRKSAIKDAFERLDHYTPEHLVDDPYTEQP